MLSSLESCEGMVMTLSTQLKVKSGKMLMKINNSSMVMKKGNYWKIVKKGNYWKIYI